MKRFLFYSILILSFSINIHAQKPLPNNASFEETQIWLEKNLHKKGPAIKKVEFEGCKVYIKQGFSGSIIAFGSSGGVISAGTPRDESSSVFSSGPDQNVFQSKGWKYEAVFDLKDLDAENITLQRRRTRNWNFINLQTVSKLDKISITENQNTTNQSQVGFVLRTKSPENFVAALQKAIEQCK